MSPIVETASTPLPSGWARAEVQGTIASVNVRSGTVVLSVAQREKTMTRTIKLASGSIVQIRSSFVEDVSELRVGDQAKVWGYALPDGTMLAAHLLVLNRRAIAAPAVSVAASVGRSGLYGVVLTVSDDAFTMLTDAGSLKEVLRAPIAQVQGTTGTRGLEEFDIVHVDGNVLSDGNYSATRIVVEFSGGGGRRISGRVTAVVPEASMLVLDETIYINVLPTTFIIQGTALRSMRDLAVGRTVHAAGPSGATRFVLKSRIVTMSIEK